MLRVIIFLLLLLIVPGCTGVNIPAATNHVVDGRAAYEMRDKIADWQERYEMAALELPDAMARRWRDRVADEGWSEALLIDLVDEIVGATTYRIELDDHWDTPSEFLNRGQMGDCEDAAAFMFAVLRYLNYPEDVRIMAVSTMTGGHALLRVRLPDGRWRIFETVRMNGLINADRMIYTPIMEFDDKTIS